MKHLYTLIFLLFTYAGFAQTSPDRGDIEGFKLYPNPATEGKVYIVTASRAPKMATGAISSTATGIVQLS